MEDRIKGIVGNPYLDWRYSERPDVPPTAAPAASTTPVITGVAQEEKSDNVQLPPDVGTDNDDRLMEEDVDDVDEIDVKEESIDIEENQVA